MIFWVLLEAVNIYYFILILVNDLWLLLRFHYKNFIAHTTTFTENSDAYCTSSSYHYWLFCFPRSNNSICTYILRCLLWACMLGNACNITRCFITCKFYSTSHTHKGVYAFLHIFHLDPFIHRFVSLLRHSHHRYFIDLRHIGNTIHLWTDFVWVLNSITVTLCRLCRASDTCKTNACRSIKVGVSGRYTIIPPIELLVL